METTKQLLNANKSKAMGNHRVETTEIGRNFFYHWTSIVQTNDTAKTFTIANGGYDSSSTNRALSSYVYELERDGYTMELHDPKELTYCERKYYKLDVNNEIVHIVTKEKLSYIGASDSKSGKVIQCNNYTIFIGYNGGDTLVADQYGRILDKLPQYIKDFIEE